MRIIGWVAMCLAQVSVILNMMANHWSAETHNLTALQNSSDILSSIGQLAIPLFLVANFALIFSARQNIVKLMLTHLVIAVSIYVGFIIIYNRYIVDVVNKLSFEFLTKELVDLAIKNLLENYLTFNVFVDLFMCSSFYFFLIYRPKKVFTDKKLIIFRLFALLPILYEVACIILKGLSVGEKMFTLPVEVMPLMTSKPLVTFLAFIFICFVMKYRQTIFVKRGGTLEQYEEFVQTNTNSFHFAVLCAVTFAVAAIIDLIISGIMFGIFTNMYDVWIKEDPVKAFKWCVKWTKAWGFGKGSALILASPIMLLFSYTKTHSDKSKMFDIIIPLAGICLCVLTYLEGFRDLIIFR